MKNIDSLLTVILVAPLKRKNVRDNTVVRQAQMLGGVVSKQIFVLFWELRPGKRKNVLRVFLRRFLENGYTDRHIKGLANTFEKAASLTEYQRSLPNIKIPVSHYQLSTKLLLKQKRNDRDGLNLYGGYRAGLLIKRQKLRSKEKWRASYFKRK